MGENSLVVCVCKRKRNQIYLTDAIFHNDRQFYFKMAIHICMMVLIVHMFFRLLLQLAVLSKFSIYVIFIYQQMLVMEMAVLLPFL